MTTTVIEATAVKATATAIAKAATADVDLFDLSQFAPITAPRKAKAKFSCFIYADKGIGKTSILGSIADVEELSPVLILATEDGTSVLAGKYDDVDVATVSDWPTASKIITAYSEGKTKYKTLAVDTFSELQELMKMFSTNNGATAMEFSNWAFIADESIKIAKMLHRAPGNVVFTTHAEKTKDESSGKLMVGPFFLGKKSQVEVLKPIDLVLYLAVSKGKDDQSMRVLLTKPDGKNMASDRTGKLAEYIPNPTFSDIYEQLIAE